VKVSVQIYAAGRISSSGSSAPYLLNRRMGVPQSWSGRFAQREARWRRACYAHFSVPFLVNDAITVPLIALKRKAILSFETSGNSWATQRHIPEERNSRCTYLICYLERPIRIATIGEEWLLQYWYLDVWRRDLGICVYNRSYRVRFLISEKAVIFIPMPLQLKPADDCTDWSGYFEPLSLCE
jgi:hypothetical protein